MNLTKIERLILLNQYRILSKLYPEEAKEYETAIEILEEGYKYNYSSLVEYMSDDVPEEISEEVYDILQMYRQLYSSYSDLDDKTGIKEDDVIFKGFDGNEEPKHYIYATFIIETEGKFSEFKNTDLNTHHNTLHKYRAMLNAWKQYHRYEKLNKEQIIEILNAE